MDFIFSVLFILVVGLFPYNLFILVVILLLRVKTNKEDGQEDLPEKIDINGQKYKKYHGEGGRY